MKRNTILTAAILPGVLLGLLAHTTFAQTPDTPTPETRPPTNLPGYAPNWLHTATEKAKSIQVTITETGKLNPAPTRSPQRRFKVTIASPDAVRFDVDYPTLQPSVVVDPIDSHKELPSAIFRSPTLLVFNGKETLEYDSARNAYIHLPVASKRTMPSLGVYLDFFVWGIRGTTLVPVKPGPDSMIDGRKMLTEEGALDLGRPDHGKVRFVWYIDAETRLPRRQVDYAWIDGQSKEESVIDYTEWKIDQPIDPSLFAWQPPAGATEITLPPLKSRPALLSAGTPAPDFTCIGADGNAVKLSDLRGKVVILDFWATWCGPCQRSMPHLEKVYRQVRDKDVTVLGVCVWDDKEPYEKWRQANATKYSFPLAFDPAAKGEHDKAVTAPFQVSGIPTQYVIDKDGKVAAALLGFNGADDHRLEAALAKLGIDVPVEANTTAAVATP